MACDKLDVSSHRGAGRGPLAYSVLLTAALGLMLAAGWGCSGSSSSSLPIITPSPTASSTPSVTMSGNVVQGPVLAATVQAFAVDPTTGASGSSLGSTLTDNNTGDFTLTLSPIPSGPIRLMVQGGSFISEQNGQQITSPSTMSVLVASASASVSGISINPLTLFVDTRTVGLLKTSGTAFSAALAGALSQVESLYGLSSDPSTLTPDYTAGAIGTDPGNLGLALGALINEDQQLCPSTPGGLVAALAQDLSDGVFDGLDFQASIDYCGGTLSAIAGTAGYQDALSAIWGFSLVTSGFAFGGENNVLTSNNVTAAMLLPSLITLGPAISAAAPTPVNSFAPASGTATMVTAREDDVSAALGNGWILIAGGQQFPDGITLASTELYNPVDNCFAGVAGTPCAAFSAPPMSTARDDTTASLLPNGKILIAGGDSLQSGLDLASTDLYDPVNNCFAGQAGTPCAGETAATMNLARDSATATLLPNGLLLIAGGYSQTDDTATCELYDSVNNCFAGEPSTPCAAETTPTMQVARDSAVAFLLPNGLVLVAGGENFNDGISLASTELYNPTNGCFAGQSGTPCAALTTPTMSIGRYEPTGTLLPNGKVLIAGGFDFSTSTVLNTTDLYDPTNNCFAGEAGTPCASQQAPVMNIERAGATATLLPNGKVLIAGGFNFETLYSIASTELYDPVNNCFAGVAGTPCASQTPPTMNVGRSLGTANVLTNGKVLIAGGSGPDGDSQATTELYTP